MGSRWRSLIGVILLLAVFGGMPALAPRAAAEPRTVTVVTHDLDPFVMRHGDTLSGFTIDLWDEISKRQAWNTVYTEVPAWGVNCRPSRTVMRMWERVRSR